MRNELDDRDDAVILYHGCMCDTTEEGWRPCPTSLCERPDHDHSAHSLEHYGPAEHRHPEGDE